MIIVTDRDPSGWWTGINQTTKQKGLFPSNYVIIVDQVTKMKESKHRHYGRPVWTEIFTSVQKYVEIDNPGFDTSSTVKKLLRPKVGGKKYYSLPTKKIVFFCGPAALSKVLRKQCIAQSKKGLPVFEYHKENF